MTFAHPVHAKYILHNSCKPFKQTRLAIMTRKLSEM